MGGSFQLFRPIDLASLTNDDHRRDYAAACRDQIAKQQQLLIALNAQLAELRPGLKRNALVAALGLGTSVYGIVTTAAFLSIGGGIALLGGLLSIYGANEAINRFGRRGELDGQRRAVMAAIAFCEDELRRVAG